MIPKKMLRTAILEALKMAAGFGKDEKLLHEMVNNITREKIPLQDFRDALEWNHGERYLRSAEEDREILYFITPEGVAKLNLG